MIIGYLVILIMGVLLTISTVVFMRAVYRTGFSLHLVIIPGTTIMAASVIWLFGSGSGVDMPRSGALFFAAHSLGLPFVVAWGEAFTRRMKAIAARGEFQLGLPAPSRGLITLGMFGQLYQDLAGSIIAVQGTSSLNSRLREIGEAHPMFQQMSMGDDGQFRIDERLLPSIGRMEIDYEGLLEFADYLVEQNSAYLSGSSASERERIIRSKVARTVGKYMDLLISENLLERLGTGMFSERASTGYLDFDKATGGGFPKRSSTLACAPPSDEREAFIRRFLVQGLNLGELCMFVSSAHPPRDIMLSINSEHSENLMIVDCYTNRVTEVSTITQEGNLITTPVELSVVKVAISRAADKDPEKPKRAIVDILPTYLIFNSVDRIIVDLMEIVDDLKRWGYTTIFSLNPYVVDDEKKILTLRELFDSVVLLERVPDTDSVSKNTMLVHVEKMVRTTLPRKNIQVRMESGGEPSQLTSGPLMSEPVGESAA